MRAVTQRIPLSVGFEQSLATRLTVIALFGAAGMPAGGCLGFVIGTVVITFLGAGGSKPGPLPVSWLLAALVGLFPLLIAVYAGLAMAAVIRRAAWLEGSLLTVQVLNKRAVDLATARAVALQPTAAQIAGSVPAGVWSNWPSATVPRLVVETPTETVRMWLASRERVLIPPAQMVALAAALSSATCPGAAEVVDWLRGTAALPQMQRGR